MQIIPLQPVENQSIFATLGGQNVQSNVYQKTTGLFVDVFVANSLVLGGVSAQNARPLILTPYLGFIGDLVWIDNQGSSDPVYTGVGSRYSLVYLEAGDIPPYGMY